MRDVDAFSQLARPGSVGQLASSMFRLAVVQVERHFFSTEFELAVFTVDRVHSQTVIMLPCRYYIGRLEVAAQVA